MFNTQNALHDLVIITVIPGMCPPSNLKLFT